MANNNKSEHYSKERQEFLQALQSFHETRGTPFRQIPKLNGHEVDLYLLYTLVTEQGGWIKVNSRNSWSDLFQSLNIPENCVNASIALKQIYLRYLDRWEKVHYLGEEADRGSDDDEESRHKRWSARALHSVPLSYNYHQHNIADSAREYNHLSTELYKPSDYDRLGLSLLSPLPNEQDFAINVCTLLSNDGKHTLKLEKHPPLVDYLLAHAGVFDHGSLRSVMSDCYGNIRKQNINNFWKESLESEEFLDLTNESLFITIKKKKKPAVKKEESSSSTDGETAIDGVCALPTTTTDGSPSSKADNNTKDNSIAMICENVVDGSDSDSDIELFASDDCVINNMPKGRGFKLKYKANASDRELFNLGRNVGTRDYMGQRVLQVATILRNLSFFEENLPVLVRNQTFVRFTLLCSCSKWNQLMNLGMEMLGNLSSEFLVKDIVNDKIADKLIKIVINGLHTEDRNWCITALEVLNKLSQNEANEDALLRYLESNVYERVCSFLTIHDVMLLIYTLECLYSLSSLGERACNYIVNIYGVIDTLVSLVTVEGKSYGPKACIGMKLVETVSGGSATHSSQSSSSSKNAASSADSTANTATTSFVSAVPTVTSIATPSAPSATPVLSSGTTTTLKTVVPTTPQRQVQIAPQRLITISAAPASIATSSSTSHVTQTIASQQLQQKHAHQQAIQENEQFALAWLKATFEPFPNGKVEHQELYKQYINACAKIGRLGVIAPLHFPRIVRSVFGGSVGPNPEKTSNPSEAQYYDGIKVRPQPLVINVQSATATTQANPVCSPLKGIRRKGPANSNSTITTNLESGGGGGGGQSGDFTVIGTDTPPASPASPILKAQLSAPPKPREATAAQNKADVTKSQVMAHPHLSQALLGSGCANVATTTGGKEQQGQSNTSLIKSLLATKVNDCMTPVSMRIDCQSVAQVAARQQQQRLLAQQNQQQNQHSAESKTVIRVESPKTIRINGARQLFSENEVADPAISSTTQCVNTRREPPQPPPPLAPLSNSKNNKVKIENEDSDSTGNNSVASSTGLGNVGIGGISSTEDGDNSLTSFEGLLNGIPSLENPMAVNDDSNSKDSIKNNAANNAKRPLKLADLLERKVNKDVPILNGVVGKELRIGDRGLELVENHIDKVLSTDANENNKVSNSGPNDTEDKGNSLKRPANNDIVESEPKKPHIATGTVNGSASVDSPAPPSVSSSNGEDAQATASTAAAKLFADLAADILEDEEDEVMQEPPATVTTQSSTVPESPQTIASVITTTAAPTAVSTPATVVQQAPVQQVFVDGNQQMLIPAQPRQIIVSQAGSNQMVIPAGTQLKTQTGQTVIVQNAGQARAPVVGSSMGSILLSQGLQGQMQLVPSGQPGQFVLQTSGAQGYVVAQPQTAMVHGQQQTVLVAQTAQQQGTGTKTIIILQQNTNTATHHQKVVVTPQGQQMVVTQVQRPILQQSNVSNISASTTPVVTNAVVKVATSSASVSQQSAAMNGTGVQEKKPEEKIVVKVKPKIVRDLTTPFVCEWGDCQIDTKFKSANQVYMHVCATHVPSTDEELLCQWDRCDNMKRKRFSLMTHINDKHCNTETMKASLIKRKQIQQTGKTDPPAPPPPTHHPGYAPDAALHAIKRHALEFVNPKELQRTSVIKQGIANVPVPASRTGVTTSDQDDNEGPVTKSIRLTASLILRNLVIYSKSCRRYLKPYEPHLANVALSNVESSRTIAQVLYDMNDGSSSHR